MRPGVVRLAAAVWAATLPLLALVGACGGGGDPSPPRVEDEVLARSNQAALAALELERPAEAARLYAAALARARERDDPSAIADAALGQATAALAAGDARTALEVSRAVAAELARRGLRAPPALGLAEATALYRLRRTAEARATAASVAMRGAEDAAAAARAAFLIGLIAAERGDARALDAARAALGAAEPSTPAFRADLAELGAWAALLRGDAAAAATRAAAAAEARREALDYRGLGRALALQAEAERRRGDAAGAADLLLRAGRGAAARGEAADARRWLGEAHSLAARAGARGVERQAREALAALRPS
jgi:hypothetical protein